MNKEEQKAIENLRKDLKENIQEDNQIDNYKYVSNLYSNGDIEVILNLISKLQKELEKSNKRINMCIDLLNEEGCLNFDTKQEKLDYIDKLIKLEEEDE